MEKFHHPHRRRVRSCAPNVDTDQSSPPSTSKRVTRTGFDDGLFNNWRTNEPDFVLNQDAYAHGTILVAGPDFGTGSSREHAVWALMDYGFKVVLSSRFADIFRGNAGKAGLLAALMDQQDIEQLWQQLTDQPGLSLTVNLEDRTVTCENHTYRFDVDDYTRWRLMEGLDDIGLTLRKEADIETYEAHRPSFKPVVK